jgi:hypothetical protein
LIQETTSLVFQLQDVLVPTNISESVMLKTAMLVDPVPSHSSQLRIEMVATDQDQLAVASRDTLKTDMLVNNAQIDLLLIQGTTKTVSQLLLVSDPTNILDFQMLRIAMHAELANYHSSQLRTDKDVIDQDQLVTASRDTLMMDIHAFNAQIDLLLTQETTKLVSQLTDVLIPTNTLVISTTATNAELALFHSSQEKIEAHATDQDQPAHATRDTLKMVTNALTAQLVKLLITKTPDVSQHQLASVKVKSLVLLKTATDVVHVLFHSSQDRIEDHAIDQSQFATVTRDIQKMNTPASHAHQDMLLTQEIKSNVSQLLAEKETQSLVTSADVMNAKTAQLATKPMPLKPDVTELSQLAHALKSMIQPVTTASNAQLTKLLLITTRDVSQLNSPTQFKFLEMHRIAINAAHAQQDPNQIT